MSYSDGTMYVISGGWGAPLRESGSEWWTAVSLSEHHFVVVDVFANGSINLQTKDLSGFNVDEVSQKAPVISEFSYWKLLPLFLIATLIVIIFKKRNDFNGIKI